MDPQTHSRRWLRRLSLTSCAALSFISALQAGTPALSGKAPTVPVEAVSWKEHTIAPVANPFFHEDAVIRSEIRPVFVYHNIDDEFLGGGNAQLYAMQIRYAITDRLAFIATQDGYFDIQNDAIANPEGWMDLALGFKYAVIDDEASQFILTPGFTFKIPTGDREVFQGRGGGEWDLFIAAQKGFGDFHLSSNLGVRLPNNTDENSTFLHYSMMADYYTCRWFIPFVAFNAYTVLDDGNNIGLDTEGYDVINFGSSEANGVTQGTLGVGFRSRILNNVDLGFAYEKAIIEPHGLTEDRFTVDVCIRF
ncbi:hypothetical protein SAMN02745166_00446 [Prosthecobacter debontii]|uniref:MetA-pathway of phenol degradation n=1 Tax=Prosthecobacter debontii TaxID=48467 RepID=A0A1T4WM45_9BACT|nr:transporter [Prosthecobacter debontii]SKA77948.1 hypothetical protein SAMN02745166_00446 [Prosthecobacter debontii]